MKPQITEEKMKKIIFKAGTVVILMLILFTGCSKFEEINTNPDAITQASSSMIATSVILANIKFNGRDAHAYLQPNALAKYLGYANQSIMPTQYNKLENTGFGQMTMLPNIDKMIEYAAGSVMENSYKGLAKFSRAWMFFNTTMQVGDIPYSETNGGMNGEYRPAYDSQEDVFIGILNELKEADQFFAQGVTFTGDPTPYNGNPDKWRRAGNAFALKVLMSLSKKVNVASLDVKNRFAAIVAGGFILEPATGFLGLNYSATNMHPMSGTNDLFTSRTDISSLLIDNLKLLGDRRLFYMADPAAAQILGGLTQSDWDAYVGADVSMSYDELTQLHLQGQFSLINSRYLKEAASEPRMMMTYAEQQLILAEARILGWITTGTAQEYYESGVKSALAAYTAMNSTYAHGMAINQAYIDGYFTGEAAFKATTEDQLKQIWMQRYILNFMQFPESSYYEYRRNNYPPFPINPVTNLNENNPDGMPMRWLYPTSETNYNRENLIEALNAQYEGYDEVNKLMWLLQ
ncbi:MAG: SusD/RagB family nutrient-binding outer membrane lipoprotein [Bacteroidales bacterium]|nr:SusD/RagB family nutrient-binding outer membrane lipoprotein [Bacteroidales bacterium]